jgi:hypothetical protein
MQTDPSTTNKQTRYRRNNKQWVESRDSPARGSIWSLSSPTCDAPNIGMYAAGRSRSRGYTHVCQSCLIKRARTTAFARFQQHARSAKACIQWQRRTRMTYDLPPQRLAVVRAANERRMQRGEQSQDKSRRQERRDSRLKITHLSIRTTLISLSASSRTVKSLSCSE